MRISLNIILLCFAGILLGACSSPNECFVSDTVNKVANVDIDGKEHTLYLRTTGFNEKEHFYELYDHAPDFDICGVTSSSPISEVHVDSTVGSVNKLVINKKVLELLYSENAMRIDNYLKIELEIK